MVAITRTELAAELGLSKARISQLIKAGLPVRDDDRLDRSEALNWIEARRLNSAQPTKRAPTALEQNEEGDEETTFDIERTRRLKLANDEKERLLIPVTLVEDTFDALVGPVLIDLVSLPARVSDDLHVRRKVEAEVDAIRNRHADRMKAAVADIIGGRDPFRVDDEDGAETEAEALEFEEAAA